MPERNRPASQHPAVTDRIGARMDRAARIAGQAGSPPVAAHGGRGGYDVDDDVFFRGAAGPRSGRVVAHGAHGCTVDEPGGERHQVPWHHVLGLKGRKTFAARVVDQGASGAILEREDGSRFFAAGQLPLDQEPDGPLVDEPGQAGSDPDAEESMEKARANAHALARLSECVAALGRRPADLLPGRLTGLPLLWERGDVR